MWGDLGVFKWFDVIGLTETWLEEKNWNKIKFRLPTGYRCIPAERDKKKGRAKGGIITVVNEKLLGNKGK